MKKLIHLIAAAALAAGGCSETTEPAPGADCGTIRIVGRTDSAIDFDASPVRSATRSEAPAAGEFSLRITGADFDRTWERVAAFEAEEHLFPKGTYRVEIAYGDPRKEGADNPCYAGATSVEVQARRTATASITARIANAQALVRATEAFLRYYHDARFTLETRAGNRFEFRPGDGSDEAPVWVEAGTTLTVTGSARGQSQDGIADGPLYTFAPEPLPAAVAATRHIFTFDAKRAGSATLTITLGDGYTETRELAVELNEGAIPDNE